MGETPITVVIADDHGLFRDGLRALLSPVDDISVVGEAATGSGAVALAQELSPDVVLMDVAMPDLNGIDATVRCKEVAPNSAVVIVTMTEDDETVFAAMCAGASGFVIKGAGRDSLLRAIRAAASGEVLLVQSVAQQVLGFFRRSPDGPQARPFPELTDREHDILERVTLGESNAQVGQALGLSAKTVANSLSRIYTKLRVSDRAQAIVRAHRAGFGG